jgi:hypothetical protein
MLRCFARWQARDGRHHLKQFQYIKLISKAEMQKYVTVLYLRIGWSKTLDQNNTSLYQNSP